MSSKEITTLDNTISWMPVDAIPCPQIGPSGEILFQPNNSQEDLQSSLIKLERVIGLFSSKLNDSQFKQPTQDQYEKLSRELVSNLFPEIEAKVTPPGLFTPRETLGSFIDHELDTARDYLTHWVLEPSFMPSTISARLQLHDNVLNAKGHLDLIRLIKKPGRVSEDQAGLLYSRKLNHETYTLLGLTHEAAFVELDRSVEEELYTEFVEKTTNFIPEVKDIWTWIEISPSGEWAKSGIALNEEEVNMQIINDIEGLSGKTESKVIAKKRNQIQKAIGRIIHLMEPDANGKSSFVDVKKMGKAYNLDDRDIKQLIRFYTEIITEQKIKQSSQEVQKAKTPPESAEEKQVKDELIDEMYARFRKSKRGIYFKIPFKVRPFANYDFSYSYFYNRPKEKESEMFKRQRGRKVEDRIAATFVCHNQLTSTRFVKFLRKQFNELGADDSGLRWIIIKETSPSKNPQATRINTDKYKAIKINFENYLEDLINSLDKEQVGEIVYQNYMTYKGKSYDEMSETDLMFLFQNYYGPSVEVDIHCFTAGGDKQSWLQLEYGPDLNHNSMRVRQLIESGVMEKLYPESIYGIKWQNELPHIIRYANDQALPKEFQFDIDEYLHVKS